LKRRSLSRRISVSFLGLALLAGLGGGLMTVLFAYATEDYVFNRFLRAEVEHLQANVRDAELPEPQLPFTTYYLDDQVPAFLRDALDPEPNRREVFGSDGKHYHLRNVDIEGQGGPVWIVLEVEDYLVVRPIFNDILAMLAVSVLILIALAAIVGWLLSRRVTRPLRSLAREVTDLEPDHLPVDWSTSYPPDEVGQLAETLREAFRRINDFIDREQQFTQDASHELRTPLAVIESSSALLAQSPSSEKAVELIERIRSAALSMHLSVDVLLALAREDQRNGQGETVAVLPIVERTVVNHADLLEGKPVELQVNVDPDWRVAGDPAALQVLIANLISNAFRYTHQGVIRIENRGDELRVVDSGEGIDDELQPIVTERAVKGPASPGLGLGLAIVERLCERQGWRFELASSPEGTRASLFLGHPPTT
jgi:signal transduction histidine kinase